MTYVVAAGFFVGADTGSTVVPTRGGIATGYKITDSFLIKLGFTFQDLASGDPFTARKLQLTAVHLLDPCPAARRAARRDRGCLDASADRRPRRCQA